jgi:nicotinamidase-related amidase
MTESRPALLVMDIEPAILERFDGEGGPELLERLAEATDAAREAGVPVIYVRVAFREGHPEISARNRTFSALSDAGGLTESDAATQVHPAVAPQPGDLTVVKKRISAFAGSDLDLLLRAGEIDTLVLTGVSTSGVVLSTIREAADRDFALVVLADGCLDGDPEVHRVLTEKVFPRQADVMTVEEWVAATGRR